jgi:DNA polymerase-3 subunit beta
MSTATKERKKTKAGGITLSAATLKQALAQVSAAVPSRHAKPILANVLLSDGVLTGTDLEVRIDAEIDYHGPAMLLPHGRLSAILSAAGGDEVTLTQEDSKCVITCRKRQHEKTYGTWTLPTEDAAEFPTWAVTGGKPVCRLPADQFCRAVAGVVYACDEESSRYALGGVCLDVHGGTVTLVATDGRRLSSVECEVDQAVDDGQTLVPARALGIMQRLAAGSESAVQLEASGTECVMTVDGITVTARLLEGKFPKWRDVIPTRDAKCTTVTSTELLSATRAAAIVTTEDSRGVQFAFNGEGIWLHGQSAVAGESSVTCPVVESGQACSVKLDPVYVRNWLTGLPADGEPVVSVEAVDHTSAVVLRCGEYTGVVMPMALD